MRILLFGGGGQLGIDLQSAFSGHGLAVPAKEECPIEELGNVTQLIEQTDADLVVNAAAYTRVDDCEANPQLAFAVNAIGVRNIALASRVAGIPLVHFSTDYVFNGQRGYPYIERDAPDPLSVYGVSKLAGERFLRHVVPEWLLIRTSALFGPGSGDQAGSNFVEAILRKAGAGETLRVVDDQVSAPTFSRDLAEKTAELVESGARGTYHVTNQGACSFLHFAQTIVEMAGLNATVEATSSEELHLPAPRPPYSVLENRQLRLDGYSPLRPWDEALQEYLGERHC
ncbi:MAG: dTDP-4-dehydrorhamnose reductase [Armatimonadetes bacterium CG2_30_59_28]|nr:dTDP-4-dehydrorhamnose reductase [Armatimonadota bacterium]OIO98674.1 MAG: dTDP-4-dehydrorhamnose reductase [Armatimonadetes bacterium CG2_30_59_28]PIU61007.1 MAG: dTDP-4-dehydrorhamnose reductase [Armatimonadetes bacterium CG07_land_8_20_14_0_80_59_28]PIX41002.1 MAG: dTDP-4-dehydrorhamnose reductase [Armatimonadetes bacterium CG_4_8_14_3_um_filter_58_9]PIY43529.1 MAG: dTDP-4-dehydrorhamnose reductase [Armatimonadetes bacterium CG_4_10_14_3_um_filter_59_10]PJB62117.1 MAG: dTDP-4-dehydrorham